MRELLRWFFKWALIILTIWTFVQSCLWIGEASKNHTPKTHYYNDRHSNTMEDTWDEEYDNSSLQWDSVNQNY